MRPEAELEVFARLGGTFVTPVATLVERARSIRGFVADWDGVFNPGAKGEGAESTYSEPDSMGTNLLRYALWRAHGALPIAALITGAENPSARNFAVREHFHAISEGPRRVHRGIHKRAVLLKARVQKRLQHAIFTAKEVIQGRFGNARGLADFAHRRGVVSLAGEQVQGSTQNPLRRGGLWGVDYFCHAS